MPEGTTIRALFVRLGIIADDDKADKFDAKLDQVKATMASTATSAKRFAAGVAGSLATAFAGVTISNAITETAELGDTAAKAGKAIGLSAESYQELAFAADRSGTSIEVMSNGLQRVSKRLLLASRGVGSATEDLKELGVDAFDASGNVKSLEAILPELADAFARLDDEDPRKAGLAIQLFGKAGAKMVPFLNEGSAGIDALRQQARDLGAVMSDETAANAEKVVDAMSNLKASLRGLRSTIVTRLFPSLIAGGEGLAKWISQGGGAEKILAALRIAVVALGSALSGLALARAGSALASFGAQVTALIPRVALATVGLIKMAWASVSLKGALSGGAGLIKSLFSLNTIAVALQATLVALPLALAAILLAGEDLSVWLSGGESAIGKFIERFEDAEGPLGMAARLIKKLAPTLAEFFNQVKAIAQDALPALMDGALRVATQFGEAASRLLKEFGPPILGMLQSVVAAVIEIAPRVFSAGRAIVAAAVRIAGALLPPILGFIATVASGIEAVAPIVAGLISFIAGLIERFAPRVASVLEWISGKITELAALAISVFGVVSSWLSGEADRALGWWDKLASAAGAALDWIKSGIDSIMTVLGPLLDGLDLAISGAKSLLGISGTTAQPERQGSILDTIRRDVEASPMSAPAGAPASATGTTINVNSVQTTVQPQPGATQQDAARMTRSAVQDSLERELQRAARDFG
jgi:hypothetical protein